MIAFWCASARLRMVLRCAPTEPGKEGAMFPGHFRSVVAGCDPCMHAGPEIQCTKRNECCDHDLVAIHPDVQSGRSHELPCAKAAVDVEAEPVNLSFVLYCVHVGPNWQSLNAEQILLPAHVLGL
jgi:hypothetical protein